MNRAVKIAQFSNSFLLRESSKLVKWPQVKAMTIQEFARLGGIARMSKLTPDQRRQLARKAGKAKGRKVRP